MKLHQYNLPDRSNDGMTDYCAARAEWERWAIKAAGGVTYVGTAQGRWVDDGKLYDERMHVYQVALEDGHHDVLMAAAFALFPDQLAIFTAELGTASIVDRPVALALRTRKNVAEAA